MTKKAAVRLRQASLLLMVRMCITGVIQNEFYTNERQSKLESNTSQQIQRECPKIS